MRLMFTGFDWPSQVMCVSWTNHYGVQILSLAKRKSFSPGSRVGPMEPVTQKQILQYNTNPIKMFPTLLNY